MAALDLARLKLRCAYKTEGDLDWDSDNLTPRQEELLMGSYRGRVFEIVEPDEGEVIGTLRVSAFHKEEHWEEWGGLHDVLRSYNEGADKAELAAFSELFTDKCYFKRSASNGGLGLFGREVTDEPYLVLLDSIRVDPEYRGKGVGSWAVKKLFGLDEEQFIFYDEAKAKKKKEGQEEREAKARKDIDQLYGPGAFESIFKNRPRKTIKYLFVRPRSIESQLSQNPDATHTLADLRKAAQKASKERVLRFFHKLGFRRVGETSFLCMSMAPNHLSRFIPADRDARDMDDPDVKRTFMAEALRAMSNVKLPDIDYNALWGGERASKRRKEEK